MTQQPQLTLTATVLDSPDARELADFYARLLGWTTGDDEPGWVTLRPPGGGTGLSFQTETAYARPTWPPGPGRQQMMSHLDIEVDDLEAASAHAVAAGAVLADYQPQEHVRVCLDPAGPRSACGSVTSAASSYVCPVDDAAEPFVVGVVVAPDDVPADHAGLLFVAGVVGAVEREVPQGRELGLYAV